MRRGTTPTLRIEVKGIPIDDLKSIYVTLKQGDIEITKNISDIEKEANILVVRLEQEETLAFRAGWIQIQLRAVTMDGIATAGPIKNISMNDILLEEVIT